MRSYSLMTGTRSLETETYRFGASSSAISRSIRSCTGFLKDHSVQTASDSMPSSSSSRIARRAPSARGGAPPPPRQRVPRPGAAVPEASPRTGERGELQPLRLRGQPQAIDDPAPDIGQGQGLVDRDLPVLVGDANVGESAPDIDAAVIAHSLTRLAFDPGTGAQGFPCTFVPDLGL